MNSPQQMDLEQVISTLREDITPVFAVDNVMKITRSSKVEKVGGLLRIASMEKGVIPPLNSCVLPISSLLSAADAQPVIYLGLQAGETPLGYIRIRLTCGPRKQKQIMRMCTGQKGTVWKGAQFKYAWMVGEPGEGLHLQVPWTHPIIEDMEKDETDAWVVGAVTGSPFHAGFRICTRSDNSIPEMGREIGYLVSSLNRLRHILRKYTQYDRKDPERFDASGIRISEAGVDLGTC